MDIAINAVQSDRLQVRLLPTISFDPAAVGPILGTAYAVGICTSLYFGRVGEVSEVGRWINTVAPASGLPAHERPSAGHSTHDYFSTAVIKAMDGKL